MRSKNLRKQPILSNCKKGTKRSRDESASASQQNPSPQHNNFTISQTGPLNLQCFRSEQVRKMYFEKIVLRKVLTGHHVCERFAKQQGFQYVAKLNFCGIWKLFECCTWCYKEAVYLFYANAEFHMNNLVESLVRGVKIEFNAQTLGIILGIDTTGLTFDDWKKEKYKEHELREKYFVGNEWRKEKKAYCRHFGIENKLLHLMCRLIVFPKGGDRTAITTEQWYFIDCVNSGIRMNICERIIYHMRKLATGQYRNLPYGCLLTSVFNHFRVPLDNMAREKIDVLTSKKKQGNIIADASLRRMQFKKVEKGWERMKVDEDEEEEEEEGEEEEQEEEAEEEEEEEDNDTSIDPSAQPHDAHLSSNRQHPSSSKSLPTSFTELAHLILTRIGSLEGKVDALTRQVNSLIRASTSEGADHTRYVDTTHKGDRPDFETAATDIGPAGGSKEADVEGESIRPTIIT